MMRAGPGTVILLLLLLLLLGRPGAAMADAILLPQDLTRDRVIAATYRLDAPVTGTGTLAITWTDALGRLVEQRSLPVALAHAARIVFPLDLRRAVVTGNHLSARLTLRRRTAAGGLGRRVTTAAADLIVPPAARGWPDYQAILWQPRSLVQYRALRRLGVTAGMIYASDKDDPAALASETAPLRAAGLGWYVENIATDFYSAYHRWSAGRPVNWRFAAVKALYQRNPGDRHALIRDPSLSDPQWLARIRRRLRATVAAERPDRPLYYSLGDETGIAELSVAWDFDYSPSSLAGFRRYLRQDYGSLAALEREWGVHVASWDAIVPPTTRQAMRRRDGNFAAWNDFKAWMDVAFARALRQGAQAIHAADPHALAAIEGAQDSGWGGYDYARLARVLDLVEIYDDGENMAALHAFAPKLVLLTTVGAGGPQGLHALWQAVLRGARGVILWDPKNRVVRADGTRGPWGRELAPVLAELRGGLGALLIASRPRVDPVAMLYSPASLRLQWMLDWQPWGDAWSARSVAADYDDPSAVRAAMNADLMALWQRGVAPRFLTDRALAAGALDRDGDRALILPDTLALSAGAARAIRAFVAAGGSVLAQGRPGRFDAHGRRLAVPRLAALFAPAAASTSVPGRGAAILLPPAGSARDLARIVTARAAPGVALAAAAGAPDDVERHRRVEMHRWQNGAVTILALQRAAVSAGSGAGETPMVLTLPRRAYLYDLRTGTALGRRRRLRLRLDAVAPCLIAITARPLPALQLAAPQPLRRGETALLRIGFARPSPAAAEVVHIAVLRPDGSLAEAYSGNLVLRDGHGLWRVPLALNDAAGEWQVRATDRLSGSRVTRRLDVR